MGVRVHYPRRIRPIHVKQRVCAARPAVASTQWVAAASRRQRRPQWVPTLPRTASVVDDQARAVFQGRITVQEGADGADARMAHNALILSDRAEVDARPELEIYADDVACAHGATVGALDDEVLFYMRQRGLPESEARILLAASFLGEVLDRIETPEAADRLRAWLAAQLEARL